MTPERPEKRSRAEALILQAKRNETGVALDFGMSLPAITASKLTTSVGNYAKVYSLQMSVA
jgi:hypothetical protein